MTDLKPGDRVRLRKAMAGWPSRDLIVVDAHGPKPSTFWATDKEGIPGRWFYVDDIEQGEEKGADQTASDPVNRPAHYARFEVEPIEFIMRNDLPFWLGNVIKYCLRWDAKDGIQDLKKARRYLAMKIKQLEGDEGFAK